MFIFFNLKMPSLAARCIHCIASPQENSTPWEVAMTEGVFLGEIQEFVVSRARVGISVGSSLATRYTFFPPSTLWFDLCQRSEQGQTTRHTPSPQFQTEEAGKGVGRITAAQTKPSWFLESNPPHSWLTDFLQITQGSLAVIIIINNPSWEQSSQGRNNPGVLDEGLCFTNFLCQFFAHISSLGKRLTPSYLRGNTWVEKPGVWSNVIQDNEWIWRIY